MTYTEMLNNLYEQMRLEIINKVRELGKDSIVGFKTIKIKDENFQFNFIDSEHYLVEVGEDNFFNENGYSYHYSSLDYEDLCQLVDYIKTLK